ncbi:6-pyruvoyl-tetrahydropterin synthase-related protein [Limosilactobacillus reuteri]|uniref:6-pyruvoyl-tetrahydropterin synthase-related protein n=1 Tax=Limosilactobacillus reuteri TaxID=1598 RepID=UPI002552049B|nr:6-pyruvoyl-tetrahydropterin synthase-related protein [Limosilactobacillus reuteri]MDL2058275.1 6-pyruvoyl-tetrahydropterin synthase-related protein [Limosilactobacillus reuteri]
MQNRKYQNSTAIIIIVVSTIVMIFPFLLIGQLGVHSDWSFHAARVQQIYLNLQRGHWITYIATDTFSKIGNANFLFYPSIFLYPWALLKFIFAPVTAYLIYVWLLFLATGLIAFYSMQSFTNGKTRQSLLFAIIYLIAPYHLYLTLSNYVLGEAQAYTFIPLILLGMWNLLYKDKWVVLAVGMTLMAYSHYVSVFISAEVCVMILVCYLIQNKKIELRKLVNLMKAVCLFILLSAWQFIPLFTDYVHGNLMRPASGFMLMQSAGEFFTSAISNDALNQGGIGVLLLVTLLFGWHLVDKNSKYMWVYLLGLAITWMITTAFPWQYFVKTPLSIIQFPYRYTSFAIAFLAIVLAKVLIQLEMPIINKNVTIGVILLIFGGLYAGSIYSDLARNHNSEGNVAILESARQGKYKTLRDSSDTPIIVTNSSYNKQFSYGALYGETDYMPKMAFKHKNSVFNRATFINGNRVYIRQSSQPNKLVYNLNVNQTSAINLPALAYRHTVVRVNEKKTKTTVSYRGTIQVKLPQGKYRIEVSYVPVKALLIARIVSIIGWLIIALRTILKLGEKSNEFA